MRRGRAHVDRRATLPVAPGDPGGTPLAASLHRLLLLGPLALADFDGVVNWAEPVTLEGRRCDHLHLPLAPGLGGMVADRLSLFIDRDDLSQDQRLQALSELGLDYLKAGLLDRAEDIFTGLRGTSQNEAALNFLLEIYQQEKEWRKAIEIARQLPSRSWRMAGSSGVRPTRPRNICMTLG